MSSVRPPSEMVILVLLALSTASALHAVASTRPLITPRGVVSRARFSLLSEAAADDANKDDDTADTTDQTMLFASLRARSLQIEEAVAARWKSAECTSKISISLEDWVRRIAVDWPRCAIGGASGALYYADLSTGDILAKSMEAHPGRGGSDMDMQLLFGQFDGGGLTAVAIAGDRVVSAGRDGGASAWRISQPNAEKPEELVPIAELTTGGAIVSAICLSGDDASCGAVWLASLDGNVRRFEQSAATGDLFTCTLTIKVAGPALCLALCEESNLLAVGTADGGVQCFAATADEAVERGVWRPLAFDGSKGKRGAATRSIEIAEVNGRRCIVVGGSDGALHLRYITDSGGDGDVFDDTLPGSPLLPPHGGQVVSLASLQPSTSTSLLVSGAHDGTLRVWDLAADGSGGDGVPGEVGVKALFGLGGYKVWLGSVWSDGRRIVSDGRDNAIVTHDFSGEAEEAVDEASS